MSSLARWIPCDALDWPSIKVLPLRPAAKRLSLKAHNAITKMFAISDLSSSIDFQEMVYGTGGSYMTHLKPNTMHVHESNH